MPPRQRSRPNIGGWSSFVADPLAEKPRALYEAGNPAHRVRVEHNATTLLIHLSDEDGRGWTVVAVDRSTRRCAIAQGPQQRVAAREAAARLYASI